MLPEEARQALTLLVQSMTEDDMREALRGVSPCRQYALREALRHVTRDVVIRVRAKDSSTWGYLTEDGGVTAEMGDSVARFTPAEARAEVARRVREHSGFTYKWGS
jgi:hypothetical protein